MYTDTEKQLNEITDNIKEEMLAAHAIDENGRAIDVKKFNQIINEKISQLNAILATTEKDGVTVDRYSANIIYTRINRLEEIKKHRTLNPDSAWFNREEKSTVRKKEKTSAFNSGIKKLFSIFQSKTRNMNSPENNR